MRNLKIRLPILFCIIAGCSRTVDVSPPISTEPSAAIPSSGVPSDSDHAKPDESLNLDNNAIQN